ncbi:TIGR02587 family membrane protein [Pleurocapsa sp. PCC 7319]|uniref:TIGR02587 family membrane protein n=1 Tax=Pleurocapsa sp. PCC 7319 TaxID=118161 RepID=UPI00034DAA2A|nr:TIGR02587 family membrane protein [Pleurocapsa sp. PCC 7319]
MTPTKPLARQQNNQHGDNWRQEITEIISGASGGFLFGIPLLYTMEVWFIGSYVQPPILLGILGITFILILLLNRIEGFRTQESETLPGAIAETIETLAIGLACATLMLIILRRIDFQTSLVEALGKIIFEGVPFSLGVAFSRSLLSGHAEVDLDAHKSQPSQSYKGHRLIWRDTLADCTATLIGALFIAFSISPTDEVTVLAASASPLWLLIIIAASLLISYGIVFASTITNYQQRRQQQGLFQTPQSETVISYLISLIAGMLMLWFFQKVAFSDPWFVWLRYGIILALPASIGGAAGRLTV